MTEPTNLRAITTRQFTINAKPCRSLFYKCLVLIAALFSVASFSADAAEPVVNTVPWVPANRLIPHETWSGKEISVKAAADVQGSNYSYSWDFGDGSPVETGTVTDRFVIDARHAYIGTPGDVFTARLTIENTATGETGSDTYFVQIREKTLETEVNVAIDEGLWYLHKFQTRTTESGIDFGDWRSRSGCSACSTWLSINAANINAFAAQGHVEGGPADDPYVETVTRGMRRLFTYLTTENISNRTYPDIGTVDPDSNGNGLGIRVNETLYTYQGGMFMDAIITAGRPDSVAATGPANVNGRTYAAIVQDMVDSYAFGQYNSGSSRGGWRYVWNQAPDNSAAQWAAIGMIPAERNWGLTVPDWVKTQNQVWLAFSQTSSGTEAGRFGYANANPSSWGPYAVTPSGMVQMVMDGIGRGDSRWDQSETWIRDRFANTCSSTNLQTCARAAIKDNYYGMFSFVKSMRLQQPAIEQLQSQTGGVTPLDWYAAELSGGDVTDGVARTLVDEQQVDGRWTGNRYDSRQEAFDTPWAILMLGQTLFEAGAPVAVAQATPNPGIAGQIISLDGSGSFHQDSERQIVGWEWDLDNDDTFETPGVSVARSFPALGDYPVNLRVTDDSAQPRTAETTVIVRITLPPLPPTADAGGPYSFCPDQSWFLDGSGSINPDEGQSEPGQPGDTIQQYAWDLDGDGSFDDTFGAQPDVNAYFGALGVGDYLVNLQVTDTTSIAFPSSGQPDLTDTDAAQVRVRDAADAACSCIADLTARPKSGKVQLVWTDTGATLYNVYRGTTAGGPYQFLAATDSRYSTYLDLTVVNDTPYYYVVRETLPNGAERCQSIEATATPAARRRATNNAPVIVSAAPTAAVAQMLYTYDVDAVDADGDVLSYSLDLAPAGMTLDAATGMIEWTPVLAQVGTQNVAVRVTDPAGAADTQTWQIVVSDINAPPAIVSSPVVDATESALYTYDVDAIDPNAGDVLAYGLDVAPAGMTIDPVSGLIEWTPGPTQTGVSGVTVRATDPGALFDTQTYTIDVAAGNLAPAITSTPITMATEGQLYTYDVEATDPDGDALTFSLDVAPTGMTIDASSGLIQWTPGPAQTGANGVAVRATDPGGLAASQTYTIDVVVGNLSPSITSVPVTTATEGQLYSYDVEATDPDGDVLTFSLDVAPTGMTIDATTGLIQWTPDSTQLGANGVAVRATDPGGLAASQAYTIDVAVGNLSPSITSVPVTTGTEGELYTYDVEATDPDGDVLTFSLDVAPAGMSIDTASGLIQWTPAANQVGTAAVTVRATDPGGLFSSQAYTINVTATQNAPPEFTRIPLLNAPVGERYESGGLAVDADGDAITITLADGPTGASLQDLGNGAFQLAWPSTGDVGDSVNFEVVATDDLGASSTLSLAILVTGSRIGNSHLGTDFWASFGFNFNNTSFGLGAMPLNDPGRKLQVLIGAPTGASGLIEIASLSFSQPFTVAPGDAVTVDLPTNIMGPQFGNSGTSAPRNDAVHITTDNPVTVAGLNWAFATTDAFLVLPVTALGTDYLVTGYENIIWSHVPPLEETTLSVLAIEDATSVTITPLGGAPLYAGDQYRTPVNVTLNRGEAWSPQYDYVYTVGISADKPVATFAGSPCADVPNGVSTCDHLWQQFVPDTSLASRYLVAPIATRTASLYRVLATEDNTRLFINDQYVALLDRGDKFERTLPGALDIVASKPVVAVQYTLGNQFDNDIRQNDLADPFMLNLAPADAFLSDYVFVVPSGEGVLRDQPNNTIRPPIEEHHVSVVIPAVAASSLVLDGVPVDTSGFVAIAATEFLSGSLPMTPGTHRMAANDAFGLHVYGFGLEESYGYYAGLIFPDGSASLDVTATGPAGLLTTGSDEACIDIEVRDLGGLRIPRARFQVNITGTTDRSYTGFSDHVGAGQYCYTQAVAGTDSVTVSVAGDSEILSVQWQADTDPATNGRPAFVSFPNLILYEQTYVYDVVVVDPDGDPVTITVTDGPAGAMHSELSGQLIWTPPIPANREPSLHSIELTATDPSGASDAQRFEVTVFYPPQISDLPTIEFVNLFGGRRETSIEHIGGDDRLVQAQITAGSPRTTISRLDLYDEWSMNIYALSFEHLEGVSDNNPMCRAPGEFIGSFDTDERFFDGSLRIPASAAGPAVDTNNDGVVDNLDDIYSFNSERSGGVSLYNLTTRQTVWSLTGVGNRHGHQPAFVNLDADPDLEFVVAGSRLIAFDTDGTELWQSANTVTSFGNARSMSVVVTDLEGDGSPEILYGPHVFNAAGIQLWQSDVAPIGRPNRALPVPADLDGDGQQEVLFGNQVRDTDGTLLWTLDGAAGEANPHAYHAVADIDGDSRLEVFSAVYTSAGPRMFAFDADGNELWNVETQGVTINYAGMPSIADFNNDGELEIFQPTARTLISSDGRILSEFDTGDGGIVELKIFDLNGDGVYETLDERREFEYYLSRLLWDTPSASHGVPFGDYNPFKFVDSDHDGKVELLITSSDGLGLYESQDGSWQLPQRDYRQHLYYDANGFNVDAYAPPTPVGLQADVWVGDLYVNGSLAGGYSFAVDVANRGTDNVTEDVIVNFYRGVPATGTLLGDVTISGGLTAGEKRTVSIPLARSEFDGMMSAQVTFGGPVDQCETLNDTVAGTFTEVEVFDGPSEYRTDRFSFIYRLSEYNKDISWLSTPPTTVTLGQTYVYDADAVAGNFGDNVRYRLIGPSRFVPPPAGAAIDTVTGVVTWTPTLDQVGMHTFGVAADSLVDEASQSFTVEVVARANEAPVITTTPSTATLLPGQSFSYDVDATDADGDSLVYELQVAPAGMTIDSTTGLVDWTPDASQIGANPVTVAVDDSFGGVTTQDFSLQVGSQTNTAPTITSVPPVTARATFEYRYQITVDDPDGDVIAYSVETGPAGMVIDGNGLLTWTPPTDGIEPVVVRVSDGQAFVEQGWTLSISAADIPLEATISATPAVANLGSTVDIAVGYSGAAGAVSITLEIDGQPVVVDAAGMATVLADTVGIRTATATVSDPYATDTATTTYTVIDPTANSTPPVVTLIEPDFEEEVTAPRDAIGSVTDPENDLLSWFLAIQPRGAAPTDFTTIASGTTEVTDDVLGQIDPTMLLNGLYSVILQATDAAGNVSQDVRVIRVTGDLKVGNFSITFEDFSAPVAGLPVTVQRTYDTRRRSENLDFGYGWTIDYQNVRLQESRDIGFSWLLIEEDLGFFSQWCVRPNGDPTVTVRMPDGEVESFVARAVPECTQLVPTIDVTIEFVPTDGTDSTLEQTDFGLVRIVGSNIVDLGAPGEPIDPDSYKLTTPEGLVFTLDQSFGIRQVEEPNGSTLTFSDAGVIHSQGFALVFNRDAQGRIESIVAPDGSSMAYTYDANGDLETFTDQVLQDTNYTYKLGVEHYLEDIVDPRGIRVSRNEYDAEGRLIAIIDADGNRIEYDHDITGRIETVRDRRGNPTIYIYDEEGNVLLETNALGETITRTYDADRNELSMTNDLGHTTSWSYDERGNQLTETNALMETTTSSYDSRNLLLTVLDPLGIPVMSNVYDPNNTNLLSMTDALSNTTTFHWDVGIGGGCSTGASRGTTNALLQRTTIQPQCVGPFAELPAWEEDARGTRTSFGYDDLGRVTTKTTTRTDEFGVVQNLLTSMEYDDKGRLFRVTDPEGRVTVTEYNQIDKASATIDANLNRTEYDYDDRGNLVMTRYPDLTTDITAYDENGNVISQTDRLGRTTRMTYDAADRLIETIFPDDTPGNDLDNPRTANEYDRAGRLTATLDERGNRTEFEYDDAGRRTLVRDALLNETRFEYDARGLRTAMVDALGRRTEFVYDDAGRLTETIFPDATPADQTDNLRSSTGYDALGRKTSETDLAGLATSFEYDEIGNLTAVIDALNQRTEYGYDEQSNKITQTDAELRTTSWTYDDVGRVVSRTLPDGQSESSAYDDNGNRIGHVDFNATNHTFGYDELNRQISATYADGVVVTTTYTDTGQVATITDDRGATSFGYDERERLTSISYPNGKTISYEYDATGNRTSLTTANQSLTYTFDDLNRLDTVMDEVGTTTYGYDAVGNRASIDYANGTRTTYAYDPLNRLLQLEQLDPLDVLFDQHTYTLGPNGNRLQHAELNGRVVDYTYDDLYRLTSEDVTDASLGDRSSAWTYDAVGNRLTQTETIAAGTTTTTYTYEDNDRLLTETATGLEPSSNTYTYDNNGNTLTTFDGVATTTYAYDSRNRLSNLNSGQTTYLYDATGIRMSETSAGLTTHYLVDLNRDYAQVVEESFDLNSFAEVKYTYGDDLIAQHRRVDAITTDSSTYHYDGIGSTRQLTDPAAAVTDSYVFTAFGETEGTSGFTPNDYLYTGEQYDPNLGFYYLRARYYNARIGRFQNMDTFAGRMSEPATLHKYLYANVNPISLLDPSGLATNVAELGAGISGRAILLTITLTVASINLEIKANQAAQVRAEARACAAKHRGTAVTDKICRRLKMPVLFHTQTRIPNIFSHVLQSQTLGSPSTLRRTFTQLAPNRVIALGKCALGLALNKRSGGNTSCDEYPFASSFEGGFSATTKFVPLPEQWSQGGTISSFYGACSRLPDVPFKNEFVVIPVVSAPTSFQCNLVTR